MFSVQERGENYPVLQHVSPASTHNSPRSLGGREMKDMGDNLRSRPMTFVSASQPATGSKQLEAGLISAFEPSDTD